MRILESHDTSRSTPLRSADDIRLVQRDDGLCAVVRWSNGTVSNLNGTMECRPYGERAVSYVARWHSEAKARAVYRRAVTLDNDRP